MPFDPARPALGFSVGSSDGIRPAFWDAAASELAAPIDGRSLPPCSFGTGAEGADVVLGVLSGCDADATSPAVAAAGAPAGTPALGSVVAAVDVAAVFARGLLLNNSVELDGAAGFAAPPAAAAAGAELVPGSGVVAAVIVRFAVDAGVTALTTGA